MSAADFFKSITDHLDTGILVLTETQYAVHYINDAAREILEIPSTTAANGLKAEMFYPHETKDVFTNFSVETLAINHFANDVWMTKASGRLFIAHISVLKMEHQGRHYKIINLRDVTFQKKMERELTLKEQEIKKTYEEILQQNQALKELDKAKDKFIALTTHELRTPLSAVMATADVLYNKLYDTPEQLNEFIGTIYHEGQHLLEIVNDILDFAKIQAGKMDFYVEELNALDLVKRQMAGFEHMAAARKIKLVVPEPKAAPKCWYDSVRLNQVVANIINNAIKFNREGKTVTALFDVSEEKVALHIRDEGAGIAPENQPKVFNEFETVGNIKSHQKGTGLGMPISKKLIEAMGGTITFVSEVGKGTTFTITIPRKQVLDPSVYRSRTSSPDDLAA